MAAISVAWGPNAQGKRRRSTEGAQGTNTGHEDAEGMASVGVRLTAELGQKNYEVVRILQSLPGLRNFA
jgi:hypothetical protein